MMYRHTHPFREFPVRTREQRLIFDGPSPEEPKMTAESIPQQPDFIKEFGNLMDDLKVLGTKDGRETLKEDIGRRLGQLMNSLSEKQLKQVKERFESNEVQQWIEKQGEALRKEWKELIDRVNAETTERLAQLRKDVGQYVDRISDEAKEAVVKSGLPEWAQAVFKFIGKDNPVTRFIQKNYYVLMANIDKFIPETLKQWLPFLKEQGDGAKIMLVKIGARDGIADAVTAMKPQGKNFEVEWTDFDAAWENHFRPKYEEALKTNPNLTSREFVKVEMMRILQDKKGIADTTLIVDLGDYGAPKPAPGISPAQTAQAPEAPSATPLKDLGLSETWKVNETKAFPDSGMEFILEKGKTAKAKVEKGKVTIDGTAYTFDVQPPDAKALFQPILSKNGIALDQSLLVFEHPDGDSKGKYSISLEGVKAVTVSKTDQNGDVTVNITKA